MTAYSPMDGISRLLHECARLADMGRGAAHCLASGKFYCSCNRVFASCMLYLARFIILLW